MPSGTVSVKALVMDELVEQIGRAKDGDLAAYGDIVRRFQNLAYGCAYAVLSDFHLAEDVAQEAFIEAYHKLSDLREPKAFPGWFRRIVLGQCNRVTRKRRVPPLTELTVAIAWWPYAALVLCIMGLTASMTTDIRSQSLHHSVILILGIELIIMFMSMTGYIIPWWTITVSMSP